MRRPALRRPVVGVHWPPARRLMKTRGQRYWLRSNVMPQIQIATRPRRRTVFAAGELLRTLAERRTMRRRVNALGLRPLRPGVWYDPRADVHYAAASWAPAGGWQHG